MKKNRLLPLLLIVSSVIISSCNKADELHVQPNSRIENPLPYTEEVVADNLNVPWAIDHFQDKTAQFLYFTERPGNVRVIAPYQRLLDEPLISFPAPFLSKGEGGLLGLVLDPDFHENHYIYVYHSYKVNDEIKNRVLRLIEKDNKATIDKVLIDDIPGNVNHNGGRLQIGPDLKLYITTGDALQSDLAQDLSSLAGKILRINLDGSIPKDNPYHASPVYSLGHRNPQGLAWHAHPETEAFSKYFMYSSEHGPAAFDEINLIKPGENYGWPTIKGDERLQGTPLFLRPLFHSGTETWAPSGMTFISIGPWAGQLLIANLRGTQNQKIEFEDDYTTVKSTEIIYKGKWGRIRDITEINGSIYILTNNRDGRGNPNDEDDKIIRLTLK